MLQIQIYQKIIIRYIRLRLTTDGVVYLYGEYM